MALIKFAFTLLFLSLCACSSSDPLDKMAPQASTSGSVPGLSIDTDRNNGKASACGYAITGVSSVPYDIKYEAVKPTLLSVLRSIHQKDRKCDWISVYLYAEGSGNALQVGYAHYRDSKIDLTIGIPSPNDIAMSQELKKQVSDPSIRGREDELDLPTYNPDYQAIRIPTYDEFKLGAKISSLFYPIENELAREDLKASRGDNKKYLSISDTRFDRVYRIVASKLGIDEPEIRRVDKLCKTYYGMSYGSETISP